MESYVHIGVSKWQIVPKFGVRTTKSWECDGRGSIRIENCSLSDWKHDFKQERTKYKRHPSGMTYTPSTWAINHSIVSSKGGLFLSGKSWNRIDIELSDCWLDRLLLEFLMVQPHGGCVELKLQD